ncbi:hypothetical protein RCL_jg26431.t1 [Rhizophagus clarus]|uniref:Uncharacterized protein n=1 Tax=Rhizophagus clarus TaxID=94130 RepID=A0A8H3LKF7_9GLOM|nr:hypothetical protein RCL_jg26431.t1 [Rhizophagus clarus]
MTLKSLIFRTCATNTNNYVTLLFVFLFLYNWFCDFCSFTSFTQLTVVATYTNNLSHPNKINKTNYTTYTNKSKPPKPNHVNYFATTFIENKSTMVTRRCIIMTSKDFLIIFVIAISTLAPVSDA